MSRPFSGVLCLLDRPSDGIPSGTKDHRILLPSAVAAKALKSLIGAPVNCCPRLRGHDYQRVLGEITSATIVGAELQVAGFLSGDCGLLDAAKPGSLGMSYEMGQTDVTRIPPYMIWKVNNTTFTGAAILLRANAAYRNSRFRLCPSSGVSTQTIQENTSYLSVQTPARFFVPPQYQESSASPLFV